eukprot:TRINITY_DN2250_c0_g3_i1.p1 TRINITY_DN2250_c0_g3~~TRINITY_DN2250_c0_g3_i1.p1  ORF type:complete len:397 (+),score=60.09 TRINITY_DN2250_c0_g3_i1:106-1296(+)
MTSTSLSLPAFGEDSKIVHREDSVQFNPDKEYNPSHSETDSEDDIVFRNIDSTLDEEEIDFEYESSDSDVFVNLHNDNEADNESDSDGGVVLNYNTDVIYSFEDEYEKEYLLAMLPQPPSYPLHIHPWDLGIGLTSHVKSGMMNGTTVAIKIFKPGVPLSLIVKEVDIMRMCTHPNIARFFGYYGENEEHKLVVEYCAKGNLYKLLHSSSVSSSVRKKKVEVNKDIIKHRFQIALGIARGMDYLHTQAKIVHCDLSSKNILLTNDFQPKISDMGMSKKPNSEGKFVGIEGFGTDRWRSPEVWEIMKKKKFRGIPFTNKIDVFSYGIIVWELFHPGQLPWEKYLDIDVALFRGKKPQISKDCPSFIKEILESCLSLDPEERMEFSEIVRILVENHCK